MAKRDTKTAYVCSNCGEEFLQWAGRCSNCGEWNTLKEVTITPIAAERRGYAGVATTKSVSLTQVTLQDNHRVPTGMAEVDRVLGGGMVSGGVILLGGEPGIGKSTLLLQLADKVASRQSVLYVSGEESPEQIRMRASRLGIQQAQLEILPATDVTIIAMAIAEKQWGMVVIDSVQTLYDPQYPSTPGSLVQVRECALRLQITAKSTNVPLVLVGHLTKEGVVAGPRTLEHLVDVVLYLEGEAQHTLRFLRGAKNRFGDVTEVGIFAMEERGLVEVGNPSRFLLRERVIAPGSVLSAILEGTRPLLVEVQALTVPSSYGTPRRTVSGFDLNRLHLLLAVLQKRAGIDCSAHDVYINVAGGVAVKDPGLDAAVCLAVASSLREKTVPEQLCVFGEVGLAGEIRAVKGQKRREKEVESLGYKTSTETSVRDLVHGGKG
jgi:DNA repair protein RadA/Sms